MNSVPKHASYDVVIIGGAMMGSASAWFLADNDDFNGRVLVVERDPTYAFAATSLTNSCIRQQFSTEINIRISQFGAGYIRNFRQYMGGDPDIPEVPLLSFGYMYLAATEAMTDVLREGQAIQAACGAGTVMMTPREIAAAYPFYNLEDIVAGSHNPVDEGYFEGSTMFDWWRRKARSRGVEFIANEVTAMTRNADRLESVTLATGETVAAGTVVNASGTRGALTARMAGIEIPIEPRRRYTFVFDAAEPLDRALPLTIDPSGVHVRSDGLYYLAGCPPDDDPAVEFDDFEIDHDLWQNKAWPAIAARIPRFERVKLINTWIGHYDYNTFDQNAIIGPAEEVPNFILLNGFSGHGFQQSPAMGRGVSELITYGAYRTLDLRPLRFSRIANDAPLLEKAII
ncbi:MAG: FAD-binding oxidoreductase [Alphaproteobacteria bacterium]|nr:FAD-binding oxidoreductase [Alphaproteobacteria bacterium]